MTGEVSLTKRKPSFDLDAARVYRFGPPKSRAVKEAIKATDLHDNRRVPLLSWTRFLVLRDTRMPGATSTA